MLQVETLSVPSQQPGNQDASGPGTSFEATPVAIAKALVRQNGDMTAEQLLKCLAARGIDVIKPLSFATH